jgi:hypothetical protein
MLRKRAVLEFGERRVEKYLSNRTHTRHRCFTNFITNLIAGLLAYSFLPKKPSVNVDFGKPPVNSVSSGIVKSYIFAGAEIVFGNSPRHSEYSRRL